MAKVEANFAKRIGPHYPLEKPNGKSKSPKRPGGMKNR